MVRVLVVARGYPSFDAPGRGSFVADHVTALRDAGAEVVVASFETVQARGPQAGRQAAADAAETAWGPTLADPAAVTVGGRFGAEGVPVARLPAVRTWGAIDGSEVPVMVARHRTPLLAFGGALESSGRRLDVIHAHNGLPDGAAAVGLATALGVPLVVTEHDSTLPDRLRHSAAAAAYRELLAAGTVVAVSRALPLASTPRSGRAVSAPTFTASSRTWSRCPVSPLPARLTLATSTSCCGSARARSTRASRRSARRCRGSRQTTGAAPASDRPVDAGRRAALEESIGALGLSEAVELEAPASREEVAAAMRRAGLFVHPSPFETFGMVAAEALASGLPVAATPSGGVEEVLAGDPGRGEVADAASPEALGAAIERLRDRLDAIDRPALRASIEVRYRAARHRHPNAGAVRARGVADGRRASDGHGIRFATTSDRRRGRGRTSSERRGSGRGSARWPAPGTPRPSRHRHGPARPRHGQRGMLGRLTGREGHPDRRPADPIEDAWRELGATSTGSRVVLVPADVEDVIAISAAFGGKGATHLAPGSLRWLGDVRDASAARVGR